MSSFTITYPPPDGEAVLSLADAKLQCRVDGTDEDALIGALRDTAVDWVERHAERLLTVREVIWSGARFCDARWLSIGPIVEVTGVSYLGSDGVAAELDGGWRLDGRGIALEAGASWPALYGSADAVTVTFNAGYTDALRPAALVHAVRLATDFLYTHRGDSEGEMPRAVFALCAPFRRVSI